MCGIVAGVAERNLLPVLLEGLRRLEYRGYDSSGVALINGGGLVRLRAKGKIAALEAVIDNHQPAVYGTVGIAHTRWATHGVPSEKNAHPHISQSEFALVHNGIIENYLDIKAFLQEKGYQFSSDTDTEVVVHLMHYYYQQHNDLLKSLQAAVTELEGAYSLAVISTKNPDRVVGARSGSPLVIGVGIGETFIASDSYALMPVTSKFVHLEEGDIVEIKREGYQVFDAVGDPVTRQVHQSEQVGDLVGKGQYRHFMQKEIYEQPRVLAEVLEGRINKGALNLASFEPVFLELLKTVKNIHIVACGTSYNAGLLAKTWFEALGIPVAVEVASEYRYRPVAVPKDSLFVSISQSGETADTFAALTKAKKLGYLASLAICNVAESSIVRESDHVLLIRAGREIGVASTKAFTTQLVTLRILELLIRSLQNLGDTKADIEQLEHLPTLIEEVLTFESQIEKIAQQIAAANSMIYLGRRELYPIVLEGALKLKELSYIHAEAYPSGELKHGPLALIDENIPVIGIMQDDDLSEKMISNLQEVQARNGRLYIIHDEKVSLHGLQCEASLALPSMPLAIAPIAITIPMQLLAYYVALARGTDVDQPRNLAKSVTVE